MSVPAPHDEPALAAAHVHVVRGAPDEVELAALVAGLVGVSAGLASSAPDEAAAAGAWADRRRTLPGPPPPAPGRDAWRWSLHP